ncbi:MAG TPA: metalloregulator ArsR/SmtB family transcription factor [Paenibacillus sp.]|nr:metalloregulator ArsR/SmtB family transcription factor [Paenibacillus sp.]
MSAAEARHDVFQAVADVTRRRMLTMLAETDQDLPIARIAEKFPISRTAVNKHLQVLSDAGLVSRRRVGRETRYRLEPDPLRELERWLTYFDRYWDNKLLALKRFVEEEEEA